MIITLKEFAIRNEKNLSNVYRKYKHGDFKTARKVGATIIIDEDEIYIDRRVTTSDWIGFRQRMRKIRAEKEDAESFRENVESEQATPDQPADGQGKSEGQSKSVSQERSDGQG